MIVYVVAHKHGVINTTHLFVFKTAERALYFIDTETSGREHRQIYEVEITSWEGYTKCNAYGQYYLIDDYKVVRKFWPPSKMELLLDDDG